jgi:hypothetical protein
MRAPFPLASSEYYTRRPLARLLVLACKKFALDVNVAKAPINRGFCVLLRYWLLIALPLGLARKTK